MKNITITPGKWQFDEDQTPHPSGFGGGPLPYLVVICGSSETVHVCGNGTTCSRADARLIATAPELLDALKQAYTLMPLGTANRATWVEMAGALIAKAEGRT